MRTDAGVDISLKIDISTASKLEIDLTLLAKLTLSCIVALVGAIILSRSLKVVKPR